MGYDVVGLGQCCLDFLALADDYPAEDMKQEYSELVVQGGGPVATALVCLARLGRKTAIIGRVGDDRFGPVIRSELDREGVATGRLIETPGGSQVSFILVNETKSTRTIFWRRGDGRLLGRDQVDPDLIGSSRILHLDGLFEEAALAAAEAARRSGVEVVVDMGKVRSRSLELAARVDHLIVSQVFAEQFAPGLAPAEQVLELHRLGPKVTVVTLGREGSLGFDGRRLISQPAFRVRALDTTGAGDVFHGGYIEALLSGADLAGRMRFASAVAGLAVTRMGGRTGLPGLAEAEAFLAEHDQEARPLVETDRIRA